MLQTALEALSFTDGVTFEHFANNQVMRRAVERDLEVIGEAARRVSAETQSSNPEIPWGDIVGQRNVLIHDYGRVDVDLIWKVTLNDLPLLIQQLKALLS
jgi:uncharacterized protein with HEPN domain